MKKVFLLPFLFLVFQPNLFCQWGLSFAYSSGKVLGLDVFGGGNKGNRIHLGYCARSGGEKKKVVRERDQTYGLTAEDSGNYFWMVDLGYSKVFSFGLTINPEISIGQRHFFTNYRDDRFSDGGYSLINKSELYGGVGLNIGYLTKSIFEPFIGYNTAKKMNFGLRLVFNR